MLHLLQWNVDSRETTSWVFVQPFLVLESLHGLRLSEVKRLQSGQYVFSKVHIAVISLGVVESAHNFQRVDRLRLLQNWDKLGWCLWVRDFCVRCAVEVVALKSYTQVNKYILLGKILKEPVHVHLLYPYVHASEFRKTIREYESFAYLQIFT